MKYLLGMIAVSAVLFSGQVCKAQGIAINADGSTADGSAMLDVKSTNKGLLAPRMTAAQRHAISSPATGLLVYETDSAAGYYYYDGVLWQKLSGGSGSSQWTTSGANIYNNNTGRVGIGTSTPVARLHVADSNVAFTATGDVPGTPGSIAVSGAGRRMMWYPDMAAFRAGYIDAGQWDSVNTGNYSVAMGNNTTASGQSSAAFGYNTKAKGMFSTALGDYASANGMGSLAVGNVSLASGDFSVAMGIQSTASAPYAIAGGANDTAAGLSTVALGFGSKAIGNFSIALGNTATGSGDNTTALGFAPVASGDAATAMGDHTLALSYGETALGGYNTSYTPMNAHSWNVFDRLLTVGNGNAFGRSDALVILKGGNTGIGTSTPLARLHVADSSVLFFATGDIPLTPGNPAVSGQGRRMMWYPDKAAFRAGYAASTQWDKDSIGIYSIAFGKNTQASNEYCIAGGFASIASGAGSIALGDGVVADGLASCALGSNVSTQGHWGAFIIGDATSFAPTTYNTADNQMAMRFTGGYRLYTDINSTIGAQIPSGGNSWSTISDRRKKENFAPVNGEEFLSKIHSFNLTSWNYKGQDARIFRHYGPMAQDFYAAFGKDSYGTVGNDTTINQADFEGVSFIAIQALERRTAAQAKEIEQLKAENVKLKLQAAQYADLSKRLEAVEASLTEKGKVASAK